MGDSSPGAGTRHDGHNSSLWGEIGTGVVILAHCPLLQHTARFYPELHYIATAGTALQCSDWQCSASHPLPTTTPLASLSLAVFHQPSSSMCHRLVLLLGLLHMAASLAVKKHRLVAEKKNNFGDFVFENGVLRRVTNPIEMTTLPTEKIDDIETTTILRRVTNPIEVTTVPTEEIDDIETTTMLDSDERTNMTSLLLNLPITKIFEDIEVDKINSSDVIKESEKNDLLAASTYIATTNITESLKVFEQVTTQAANVKMPPKR